MRLVLLLLSALVTVAFGAWAYNVNYETQAAERRAAALGRAIEAERARIAALRAEWAWLTRPERLRALVLAHQDRLGLAPIEPRQFAETGDVALPVPPPPVLAAGWDGVRPEDLTVTVVERGFEGPRPLRRPRELRP